MPRCRSRSSRPAAGGCTPGRTIGSTWSSGASPISRARAESTMTGSNEPVVVAGLGDLHVEESAVHPYRALFTEISEKADVLALCGDLTNLGRVREAEILAEDLHACTIPVIGVLGNHDYEC